MPIRRKIGLWPAMTLKEAWEIARKYDPKAVLSVDNSETFSAVAESFLVRHVEAEKLRTQYEIERCLKVYVMPKWQDRVFREIKKSDVNRLLDTIQDKHGARQADMVLAIIRSMTNWYAAKGQDDDYVSPIVKKMRRYKPGDHKRTRVLTDDEIRLLWEHADGVFGALLKVLLLTGQREAKVVRMQRTELRHLSQLHATVWHIPKAAREKNNPGTLQLPQMVLDIIEAQDRIAKNPYVFVGRGGGHFNSFSECKAELDEKLAKVCDLPDAGKSKSKRQPMQPWVIHDLRRTAKTLMQRAGVRPDISERVLGHVIKGVEGVYDQHTYDEEKAEALDKLATIVTQILNPPAVTRVLQLKAV